MKLWEALLEKKEKQGRLRSLKSCPHLIDFASNDYLGLACSAEFVEGVQQCWKKLKKCGSTGSRLLTGHSDYIEQLEEKIARFHQAESALLFSSGFLANQGVLSTIACQKDAILYDSHAHTSTKIGIQLSKAQSYPWKHLNLAHLEKRLQQTQQAQHRYVFVESISSCDGALAPLQDILDVCEQYQAQLIVDEAHATGVVGCFGEGVVQSLGLQKRILIRIHTYSKALGVQGAAVLGSTLLKNYLINTCPTQMYTTAPAYPVLAGIESAYDYIKNASASRIQLEKLIQAFCKGLITAPSQTPIQSILIKGDPQVMHVAEKCQKAGFDVRALRYPTVRVGEERLRILLHSYNTLEQVELFIQMWRNNDCFRNRD